MTVTRIMKIVVYLFSILTITPLLVAAEEERVLGLLKLPQVFGNGACDRFVAETITAYERPEKIDPIATVQVENSGNFQ